MREIVVRNGKVFYKDELQQEKGEFPKPEMSLRHIQADKQGLNAYLEEISNRDIKFISMSAKIFGKEGTYDILIEEAIPSKVGVNLEGLNVRKKLREPVGIKAELHIEEGVFVAFTGKKMQPGDFFFEKVLVDGQIIEMPINVERVIDGVDGLYQIIYDEDGSWGYNVWAKGADVKRLFAFIENINGEKYWMY